MSASIATRRMSCAELGRAAGLSAARVYALRKRGESDAAILAGTYKRRPSRHWGAKTLRRDPSKPPCALGLELGARIRQAREARGVRQQDLASATGIYRANVTRIESGKHVPSLDTLCRIARALECDVSDLVRGVQGV